MPPPGLHENDAGILDVFQGVFVQSGGKYASKMRAAIYSVLPLFFTFLCNGKKKILPIFTLFIRKMNFFKKI